MQSHNSNLRIIKIVFAIIILAGLVLAGRYFLLKSDKPTETYIEEARDTVEDTGEKAADEIIRASKKEFLNEQQEKIPDKIQIDVPFTSQAPFAVWDERHQEACEEASIIMLKYYLDKKPLTPEIAEQEIQKAINFQIRKYGDYRDTDAQRTVEVAEDLYGIDNLKVVYDFPKVDLKRELAKKNPIIVPAAGRELGNPYYTQPGPLYHMLVLTGYSGDQIITNDPGTRRGENYRYDIDVLYGAIHDFPGDKDRIKEGRRAMIIIVD